jgi:hypothetical protein
VWPVRVQKKSCSSVVRPPPVVARPQLPYQPPLALFFLLNLPTWHSYTATVQKIISLCPIFLQPKRDCRGDNFVTAQRRYGTARKGGYYFLDKKQLCEIKSVHQINSQKIRRRRIRREKGAYDTIIPATDWLPRRPAAT